jgi:hypothetical protein
MTIASRATKALVSPEWAQQNVGNPNEDHRFGGQTAICSFPSRILHLPHSPDMSNPLEFPCPE